MRVREALFVIILEYWVKSKSAFCKSGHRVTLAGRKTERGISVQGGATGQDCDPKGTSGHDYNEEREEVHGKGPRLLFPSQPLWATAVLI